MNLEESREYKAAKDLEDSINSMGWNPNRFAESVGLIHPTLQQVLMRTIVATIKHMGSDNFSKNIRNHATHNLCKKIVESGVLDDVYLPFI